MAGGRSGQMSGMERRPDGHFGFARRPQDGAALLPADLPSVGDSPPDIGREEIESHTEQKSAPRQSGGDGPTEDDGWVVRPKVRQAGEKGASSSQSSSSSQPRMRRRPGVTHHETASLARSPEYRSVSKRWFALGLAGMVYVTGIAGLWSMVQAFDGPGSPAITPADGNNNLPPLDHQVDMQDARLDGPFIPRFRPEIRSGDDADIANSDFQKKI